jgi:hypothetical protein
LDSILSFYVENRRFTACTVCFIAHIGGQTAYPGMANDVIASTAILIALPSSVSSMGKHIGADWASKGWFGVILRDDEAWETDHFPTIWSLWKRHSDASRIFIDIPIGLPADSKRTCDVEARQKLEGQGEYLR